MRTVRTKVYKFDELDDKAKEKAIDKWRDSNDEIFWAAENRESMKSFAEIFPIKVTNWSYGGRGEGVDFRFEADDCIEELKGVRLATYLWNNYKDEIYSRKYYKSWTTKHKVVHRKVKSIIKSKQTGWTDEKQFGEYWNKYTSDKLEEYNCPLTGYCMDNELLHHIWLFIKKPDNRNFKDLLEDCFAEWIKACNRDIEDQNSFEYIAEHLRANEYEFTADGRRF